MRDNFTFLLHIYTCCWMNVLCILCCEVLVLAATVTQGKLNSRSVMYWLFILGIIVILFTLVAPWFHRISYSHAMLVPLIPVEDAYAANQPCYLPPFLSLVSAITVTHTLIAYSNQDFMLCLDWLVELHFLHWSYILYCTFYYTMFYFWPKLYLDIGIWSVDDAHRRVHD
jgi:hypothetical protein